MQIIAKDKKSAPRMATQPPIGIPSNHGLFAIREELTTIRTLDLISKARSILEKIFWAVIAISGTIFIYDVVFLQLENWRDNPTLMTTVTKRLADLPLPAATFCHKGFQKYGVVEHLGNYIHPEKKLPREVLAIRNEFLKVQYQKINKFQSGKDFCEWLFTLRGAEKLHNPILSQIPVDERDAWKTKCIVSLIVSKVSSQINF